MFGATGMVGQGVLRACLLDPGIDGVLVIGRRSTGQHHAKLREVVLDDLFTVPALGDQLDGYDACFYCLGVSAVGLKRAYLPPGDVRTDGHGGGGTGGAESADDVHLRLGP